MNLGMFNIGRIGLFAVGLLFLFTQCNTPKSAVADDTILRVTDTIYVSPEVSEPEIVEDVAPYRATYERTADLIHTDLNLSFNYEKKEVNGRAKLTLQPLFYDISSVNLHAKNFTIKEISMQGRPVNYTYDDQVNLIIDLDKTYTRGESFDLFIQYIAHPYEGEVGGSAAIMSDRGLYFIDPADTDPYKPTQIWTQGETESSSRWFPTIDKPNERCTQKVRLRVKSEYETLSNGVLTASKDNGDGTRTDTWEMKQPHAPYLFMLTIGDFHREKDTWQDVPLEYLVEHDYAKDAKVIFNHTPEMLTFFSEALDYKYPWPKYAQVIGRDYVSGAMENTTASLFGQFLQRPEGDLIDNGNDHIVAHELFHHWFGDLVTCESWSNLTLNEGFANYSEYLWSEHKYGRDAAEHHRQGEFQGYLAQAQHYMHPLVDFHYGNKEDMFDSHSYNKGGMVLHMLRHMIGDDAFFASLNYYLNEMEYQAAEVHDLRLAFERVTGLDLNWFFDQWFLKAGHPVVKMDYKYVADAKTARITITQEQNQKEVPLFRIPTEVVIYTKSGRKFTKKIIIDGQENNYSVELDDEPTLVLLDPERIQLMEHAYNVAPSTLLYKKGETVWLRLDALNALSDPSFADREALAMDAIDDGFWAVRQKAIQVAGDLPQIKSQLADLAKNDAHANVRVTAINAMENMSRADIDHALKDKSTRVQAAAAMKLLETDAAAAMTWADNHSASTSQALLNSVASIFVDQKAKNKTEFFERSADRMSLEAAFQFYTTWSGYVVNQDADAVINRLEKWSEEINSDETGIYKKYAILTALQPLSQYLPMDTYDDASKTKIQGLLQNIGMAAMKMFGGG